MKGSEQPKLTVGIIAKNEQRLLPHCLRSIRGLADEIIVVDTGSRDRTIAIAEKFGARVLRYAWSDNFSKARNVYVRAASHPWILTLDADEVIAARDFPLIREAMKRKSAGAFTLSRRAYTSSSNRLYFGWYPNDGKYPREERLSQTHGFVFEYQTRLFRNKPSIHYDESVRVHENIGESVRSRGFKIKKCAAVIHDFSCLKKRGHESTKQRRYCETYLKECGRRLFNAHELSNLAVCHAFFFHDIDKAIDFERQAVRKKRWSYLRYYLSVFLREKGERKASLDMLRRAMRINPKDSDSRWLAAITLDEAGHTREALRLVQSALKLVPGHPLYLNTLGVIQYHLNDQADSIQSFRKALAKLPSYSPPQKNLRLLGVLGSATDSTSQSPC